ncbi:MAG: hypothetical protein FWC59_03605 [Actinomycetia bacterium]|nr:hypothetical protein [Actinomycetes bacterium]
MLSTSPSQRIIALLIAVILAGGLLIVPIWGCTTSQDPAGAGAASPDPSSIASPADSSAAASPTTSPSSVAPGSTADNNTGSNNNWGDNVIRYTADSLRVGPRVRFGTPHPLAIIYIPGLNFRNISPVNTPMLYQLAADSGMANLSAPIAGSMEALQADPHVAFYVVPDSMDLATVDDLLAYILPTFGSNYIIALVGEPYLNPESGQGPSRNLTPIILRGNDFNGYLSSHSTHRSGLITAGDLVNMVNHLNRNWNDPQYSAATILSVPNSSSPAARLSHLAQQADVIMVTFQFKPAMDISFVLLVFLALAVSAYLLFVAKPDAAGGRRGFIATIRYFWLLVLSFPPASFLMFLLVPTQPAAWMMPLLCFLWMLILSGLAVLLARRTDWIYALIALFALSILVIVIGQIFGGPLAMPGYLTYDIMEGSRYYGMGNEQGAMVFGSWITLSGLMINNFPTKRWPKVFRRWLFPIGSFLLLLISAAPFWGASFGQLTWGTAGCVIAWWKFNGRPLRVWQVLAAIVGAFVLAVGVLYLDVLFNPLTHMQWVIPYMHQGLFVLIFALLKDVWDVSISTMGAHVPVVALLFGAAITIFLVVLLVLKPGFFRDFWQKNPIFQSAYAICLFMSLVAFCVEDSGVFTPAVILIYPISCLVWLVADHRNDFWLEQNAARVQAARDTASAMAPDAVTPAAMGMLPVAGVRPAADTTPAPLTSFPFPVARQAAATP